MDEICELSVGTFGALVELDYSMTDMWLQSNIIIEVTVGLS